MNKRLATLITAATVTLLLLLYLFVIRFTSKEQILFGPTIITPTPIALTKEKITISGIAVNNFFIHAKETNKTGDALLVAASSYRILYAKKFNEFLILITSSPFPKARENAEQEFLRMLGVTEKEACALSIVMKTSYDINPDYAGKHYALSFCENRL